MLIVAEYDEMRGSWNAYAYEHYNLFDRSNRYIASTFYHKTKDEAVRRVQKQVSMMRKAGYNV